MRSLALLVMLVGTARAAEPRFKDIFDPGFRGNRASAFTAAVARSGIARAIRHYTAFEAVLAAAQKRLDQEWGKYAKVADKWWDWRRKYEASHQKKYKRPPAEYPVPDGLNRAFIDQEKALKKARTDKMKEQLFQEAVLQKTHELLGRLDGGKRAAAVAAAAKGLKDKNRHQRIRCAGFLETLRAARELELGLTGQKHPVVLQRMLEALGRSGAGVAVVAPYLNHPAWPVRAGAVAALGAVATGEANTLLEARRAIETGRLRDDIALASRQAPAGPVGFLGIPTSSRALVYCLDGAIPGVWNQLREACEASLDSLPADALFGLVVFDVVAQRWKKKLQKASPGNKAAAKQFLARHEPAGGSNLHAGLLAALDLAAARGDAPAVADTIFVATIYGPRASQIDRTQTVIEDPRHVGLEVTKRNEVLGVRIHAFGKSGGKESFYLQAITRQFLGTHLEPR